MRTAILLACAVGAAAGTLPPLNSFISFEPITAVGEGLRHCDYVVSLCAIDVSIVIWAGCA